MNAGTTDAAIAKIAVHETTLKDVDIVARIGAAGAVLDRLILSVAVDSHSGRAVGAALVVVLSVTVQSFTVPAAAAMPADMGWVEVLWDAAHWLTVDPGLAAMPYCTLFP